MTLNYPAVPTKAAFGLKRKPPMCRLLTDQGRLHFQSPKLQLINPTSCPGPNPMSPLLTPLLPSMLEISHHTHHKTLSLRPPHMCRHRSPPFNLSSAVLSFWNVPDD